jgi:hypothetical protein
VNISDPKHPLQVSKQLFDSGVLLVKGFKNYVAIGGYFGLEIFDVSVPDKPKLFVEYFKGRHVYSITFDASNMVVDVFGPRELYSIDINNFGEPRLIKKLE